MSALEVAIAVYRKAGHPAARARVYGAELLAMNGAEVLREAADFLKEIGTPITGKRIEHERGVMYAAERLGRMANAFGQAGKDTREHQADESTQSALEIVPLAEGGERS